MRDASYPATPPMFQAASPEETGTLAPGAVHVWLAELEDSAASGREELLSDAERERAGRIRSPQARGRWLAARGLLRSLLGSYLGGRSASAPLHERRARQAGDRALAGRVQHLALRLARAVRVRARKPGRRRRRGRAARQDHAGGGRPRARTSAGSAHRGACARSPRARAHARLGALRGERQVPRRRHPARLGRPRAERARRSMAVRARAGPRRRRSDRCGAYAARDLLPALASLGLARVPTGENRRAARIRLAGQWPSRQHHRSSWTGSTSASRFPASRSARSRSGRCIPCAEARRTRCTRCAASPSRSSRESSSASSGATGRASRRC